MRTHVGRVLEMWGYSIACARVGIKHYVWQQIQIEPSSTWHQNVTVEEPYIYHYTFGVEYSSDGIPMVPSPSQSAPAARRAARRCTTRTSREDACRWTLRSVALFHPSALS
jgi:hypothetical protein